MASSATVSEGLRDRPGLCQGAPVGRLIDRPIDWREVQLLARVSVLDLDAAKAPPLAMVCNPGEAIRHLTGDMRKTWRWSLQ